MQIRPRWQKVLADLWINKTRSLLIIASIAVGLLAVGVIATLYFDLNNDMSKGFARVTPANVLFKTSLVDQDMVKHLERMDGVKAVDGARDVSMQVLSTAGNWNSLNVQSKDWAKASIGQVTVLEGSWPPGKNQIAFANHKIKDLNVKIGEWITIQNSDGEQFSLQVSAIVKDQMLGAAGGAGGFFAANTQAYVDEKTLEKIHVQAPEYYSTLQISLSGDSTDASYLKNMGENLRADIEDNGVTIYNYSTRSSLAHPNIDLVNAIVVILFMLTFLIVFLSGFLITSSLQFLLNQQVQQVGIMKSIGGTRRQIMAIYLVLISIFGVLAFFLTLPVASFMSDRLLSFLSDQINFTYFGYRTNWAVLIIQIFLALIVPIGAAYVPILRGTNLSVQEALSGIQQQIPTSESFVDRLIARLKGLSRPTLIALRNVFRNKGRLILTLVTLSLGGAVFISVFSVRVSFNSYIDALSRYFLADINIALSNPERVQKIENMLYANPEVGSIEAWSGARASILNEDGSVGDNVNFTAVPNGSQFINPIMVEGRWLDPRDENAIALDDQFQSRFPDLKVGDTITLKVNDKDTDFVVVGFFQLAGKLGGYAAYVNMDYFNTLPGQVQNLASVYRVNAKNSLNASEQKQFAKAVQSELEASNIEVSSITTANRITESSTDGFNILTTILLVLAILIALVGSIGLTGTMSMNIMERTREIGIMRSIGASDQVLTRMVLIEGLIIGWLSWILGAILSFPISTLMSNGITRALFGAPSGFGFSITGYVIWFVVVSILSVLSSLTPARSATRLTIREVLSYE
ncbi:MAG: FtsX-like permease family protein [Anaerolineaceae bacterium]|nr:FtsX-like permease family protein [Anaerolineaceae bacterium]